MSHRQQKSHGEPSSIHPAVRWFFRLRGPESPALGPEELQAWESFAAAPANREELVEIEELWQTVRTLGGPRMPTDAELEADDFDDSLSVRQWGP